MEEELRKAKKDFEYLLNPDANPITKKMKKGSANLLKEKLRKQQEKILTANSSADLVDVTTEMTQKPTSALAKLLNYS